MKRNIIVSRNDQTPVEKQDVEMVERKGIGHPDSLADGMAEEISRNLCKAYLKQYGAILHHNTDKLELVGGRVKVEFGGGKIIQPMFLLLSGRATTEVDGKPFPVHEIGKKTALDYMASILPNLDVKKHVIIDSKIGYGSADLTELFNRKASREKKTAPLANDTSFGVGYAPFSEVENLVMGVENLLNSKKAKKKYPEIGEDIKVMGMRNGDKIILTIAAAFVSSHVPDFDHYCNIKDEVKEYVMKNFVDKKATRQTEVHINTADNYQRKVVYLTLTGTSAEHGDDGCVGRGNRANGLITPSRKMSLEATAGKNPVNHIGKLYNILANRIASDINEETGAEEVCVRLLSQIGKPIDLPLVASIELLTDNKKFAGIKSKAESIANEHLANITKLTDEIINGKVGVF